MSYEPTNWKKGDKVTSTRLNKIEQGIQGNDTEISDLKEGLNILRPTATSEDVGKALIVKTVADGVPTEFEYGEAGGGSDGSTKELMDLYIDFVPNYKVEEGYYSKHGNTVIHNAPNRNVGSCKITDIISCKEGYVYSYSGASSASLFGYALFNDDTCVSVGALGPSVHQLTIPSNINGVMFQSYAAPNNTPELTVDLISPVLLTDVTGRGEETEGKIWTKTENGAEWQENAAESLGAYNTSMISEQQAIIEIDDTDFAYTSFSGGGYKYENGQKKWMNYGTATGRITEKIPCIAGEKFLFYCGHSFGAVIPRIFYYHGDTITDVVYAITGVSIITIPTGVDGVIFQSVFASAHTYVEKDWVLMRFGTFRMKQNIAPLNGIKWCVIGDSISMPSSSTYQSYCDYFNNDGMICTNLAISGTGFSVGYGSDTKYYDRIAQIPSDTQFIVVTGSFNDLNRGPDLGTIDDMTESTIAGCMNMFFTELITQFPTVPMALLCTCPWSDYRPGNARSDAYVAMLESISNKYGVPFCSLYNKTNLRPWNTACKNFYYYKQDGVHPGSAGHRQIYALLKPFFEQMCYQGYSPYAIGKTPTGDL